MGEETPEQRAERIAERARAYSARFYKDNSAKVRKNQLLRKIQNGAKVKSTTLEQYGIPLDSIPADQIKIMPN